MAESIVLSIKCLSKLVIYVDSGSTDKSVELAISMSVDVIELDMSIPFSAARARNAGFKRLKELQDDIDYVQFIDGDCEISRDWGEIASQFLDTHDNVAVVAGRLNERFPEHSIYNRLADLEWNYCDPGEINAVGGIFLVRLTVFADVGGFNETVSAGEEPELCYRIKQQRWKIIRIDHDMAQHDLAMSYFTQWWKRQVRGGYGGLDIARRFGLDKFKKNCWRSRFWLMWPFLILVGMKLGGILVATLIAILWPIQFSRIAFRLSSSGKTTRIALAYAWFTMISFWPQSIGQIYYMIDRIRGRKQRLIEYRK